MRVLGAGAGVAKVKQAEDPELRTARVDNDGSPGLKGLGFRGLGLTFEYLM